MYIYGRISLKINPKGVFSGENTSTIYLSLFIHFPSGRTFCGGIFLLIFHKQPLIKDSYRYIQTEQQLNSTSQDDNALYMWRMRCNILPVIQYYILSRRTRCFGLKYNSYILINRYNTVQWWQMSGTQSVWKINKNIYICRCISN